MVLGQQALCLLTETALCEDEQDTMASLSGVSEQSCALRLGAGIVNVPWERRQRLICTVI